MSAVLVCVRASKLICATRETPGEDPFLAGAYGAAMTIGMQGRLSEQYVQSVTTLKVRDLLELVVEL